MHVEQYRPELDFVKWYFIVPACLLWATLIHPSLNSSYFGDVSIIRSY